MPGSNSVNYFQPFQTQVQGNKNEKIQPVLLCSVVLFISCSVLLCSVLMNFHRKQISLLSYTEQPTNDWNRKEDRKLAFASNSFSQFPPNSPNLHRRVISG